MEAVHPRFARGDRFGRYVVDRLLGRGGMGEVWVVYDESLGRRVALKLLSGGDERSNDRLLTEARAAAAIEHPNAVQVFDVGEIDGTAFLTMELLEGAPLRTYVGTAFATLATRKAWLVAIARVLGAGHARGVVHRDVKPENVFVRSDGVAKVLDFGLATRARVAEIAVAVETVTARPGEVPTDVAPEAGASGSSIAGTVPYMAPEQLRGENRAPAIDQWAWGVLAYELLVGRLPWDTRLGVIAVVSQIFSREPEPPHEIRPEVPEALSGIVLRALERDPARRFPNMDALADALEACSVEPGHADARPTRVPVRGSWRAWLSMAAIAGGVALLFVVGARRWSTRGAGVVAPVVGPGSTRREAGATDGDSPVSPNPVAAAAYASGIAAIREAGSVSTILGAFERALEADPELAAAHLRAALTSTLNDNEMNDAVRVRFGQAQGRRERLNAHDRALVDAVEPWFRFPQDVDEVRRRFARLARENDAEYALWRCWFLRAASPAEALDACRDAERLDPALAVAYLGEGFCHLNLGDAAAERVAFDACLAHSQRATRCMRVVADIDIQRGRCEESAALSRRLVELTPDDPDAWLTYEHAVYAEAVAGRSDMEAYRRALSTYVARARDQGEQILGDAAVAVAEGRLADAARLYESHAKLGAHEAQKLGGYVGAVEALLEIDDTRGAVAIANRIMAERPAWDLDPSHDVSILAQGALYAAGASPRARFVVQRQGWLDGGGSGRRAGYYDWLRAFAVPMVTEGDAREAAEAMNAYAPFPALGDRMIADARVGHVLLRAGRVADAIAPLRAAAGSCPWVWHPLPQVQALGWLGEALAANGDHEGACAAFAQVIAKWGASSASRATRTARSANAQLGCAF